MTKPTEGDTVRVKIRSEPGSERVVHKFEGEITNIDEPHSTGGETQYRVRVPVGLMNVLTIRQYEAEFEVIEA